MRITSVRWLQCVTVLLATVPAIHSQGILGSNLIVNGDAESGTAGTTVLTVVSSIPGWTRTAGNANVLPYTIAGYMVAADPGPQNRGFNYFVSGPTAGVHSLTQNINVSSAASTIGGGNVKYTASAYLGSAKGSGLASPAQMSVAFENASGQTFSTITVGPLGYDGDGMELQQQIGLVPAGTMTIVVTLSLSSGCENAAECDYGAADNLSLVLTPLGTSPSSVLGTNLIVNGNAEAGAGVPPDTTVAYVPGWATARSASVAPYGGTGWIQTTDPGPADRGVNLFCGPGDSYQDLDVSPAAALIDAGQVTYEVSAWLGGTSGSTSPTLTYEFFDWSGTQLAPTAQLGPSSHPGPGLIEVSHSGTLPSGTRRVHIALSFPNNLYTADDIAFTLAGPGGPPVITPGGIVSASAFGGFAAIAPGSWIEIYGNDLTASAALQWSGSNFTNGVGPTQLGDVTVSIGGKAAFIDYISPSQVNALVPSNAPVGPVEITVTNSVGASANFPIYVDQTQPGFLAPSSFMISGKQYVAALFTDGQTFALPQSAIPGVPSHPANVGDTLIIYGVGFGPVTGGFTAGTIVTAQNATTAPVQIFFNNTTVTPSYSGLAPSFTGLYQFNVVVPSVGANGAMPISFTLGGVKGTQTLYIAVGN
jgi:uncharacterized protein (TIGR03437 family)